jgi:fumarylpyruvate hydrolase
MLITPGKWGTTLIANRHFFQKSPDNLLPAGSPEGSKFPYPTKSVNVQHEIEMVCALGAGGSDIPKQKAMELI